MSSQLKKHFCLVCVSQDFFVLLLSCNKINKSAIKSEEYLTLMNSLFKNMKNTGVPM